MEINYTRKHNESFMNIAGTVEEINYEKKMIDNNHITALLSFNNIQINGECQYNYNISRKENIRDFIESRAYSVEAFKRLFINLQIALTEIEKYLIAQEHLLLTEQTLFIEKANDNYKVALCYYPKDNGSVKTQIREMMESILTSVDSGDRKAAELVFGIYDICVKEEYTIEEIIDYLNDLEEEPPIMVETIDLEDDSLNEIEEYAPSESLEDYYNQRKNLTYKESIVGRIKGIFEKKIQKPIKESLVFEDFVIEPDTEIEERTVLLKDTVPAGKLVYDGQNGEENFIITKDVFRIGSAKNNDAVLKSKAVSSSHAKIYRENGSYYLEDLNSLNGSFLGNSILNYKDRVKLKTMDVIRFADVSYVFM